MSQPIMDVNLTARRVCILHELGTVADRAHGVEESERANILHSHARHIGANGATRAELITLAAYALATVEAMDEERAR